MQDTGLRVRIAQENVRNRRMLSIVMFKIKKMKKKHRRLLIKMWIGRTISKMTSQCQMTSHVVNFEK